MQNERAGVWPTDDERRLARHAEHLEAEDVGDKRGEIGLGAWLSFSSVAPTALKTTDPARSTRARCQPNTANRPIRASSTHCRAPRAPEPALRVLDLAVTRVSL